MSRKINFDDLGPDDLAYFVQRPWLKAEYEQTTGKSFADLDFGVSEDEANANQQVPYDFQARVAWVRETEDPSERAVRVETVGPEAIAAGVDYVTVSNALNLAMTEVQQTSGGGDDDDEDGEPYDKWSPEDLREEAEARDLDVTGTGKDGNVLKADLVAALEADDEANAE